MAIVCRVEGSRGWALFPRDLVHGGNPSAGSWIILKVRRETTTELPKEVSHVMPGVSRILRQELTETESRIIMVEATEENLEKIRDLKNYANIPCHQKYDDFVRIMNSTDGHVCAVNHDFRLKKNGESVVLELCNPQQLEKTNKNDLKLMACHNQEIIGKDGDNRFLLANGMIVWINCLCWVDQLHLLKIIPIRGQIMGNHREGRYLIPTSILKNDGFAEEPEVDGGSKHYMTPADFPGDCESEFLGMGDADCRIPKIPCEYYDNPRDMSIFAEKLRS